MLWFCHLHYILWRIHLKITLSQIQIKKSQPIIFKTEGSSEFHQTLTGITTTVRLPLLLRQPSGLPPGHWQQQKAFMADVEQQQRRKRRNSWALSLGFRFSGASKNLETWAKLQFLSALFSPSVPFPIDSCSFPILCILWSCITLNPDPSHHLLFLCPLFPITAVFYSSFPQSCRIQSLTLSIFIQLLTKTIPPQLCTKLPAGRVLFFSPVQLLCKVPSEQESPCLGCSVTAASQMSDCEEHPALPTQPWADHARSLGAALLSYVLSAHGGSSEDMTNAHCRRNLEITGTNWRYKYSVSKFPSSSKFPCRLQRAYISGPVFKVWRHCSS